MSDNPFSSDPNQYGNGPSQPATSNNSWIWILAVVVLLFVVMPVVCCGGFALLGMRGFEAGMEALKAPVEAAVTAMNDDPNVTEKLGSPIQSNSSFGVNQFENHNGNGSAEVDFNVTGPDGTARVKGKMRLTAGAWSPEDLTIQCSDGTELKLP